MTYSHQSLEKKWQKIWLEKRLFHPNLNDTQKPKLYLLDMFPYPSGSGLHVGHLRGYLATDILTRMKMMQGYNVFHPIGFDSFGLPAEQYALQTGHDPKLFTEKNIANFLHQLQSFGFAYDYQRIIKTHNPHYYHWTQWIFLQFWKKGLAVEKLVEVNFCPQLNTVLANEETVIQNDKMVSERGNYPVFRQKQKQWVLKITTYAQKLFAGLSSSCQHWPSAIINAQKNWIGPKKGYFFSLPFQEKPEATLALFVSELVSWKIAKFIVIALTNDKYDHLLSFSTLTKLQSLRHKHQQKPLLAQKIAAAVSGLKTNLTVLNPLNPQEKLTIYYGDYIDSDFATGTKLAIPQSWTKITDNGEKKAFYSEDDYFFALKYHLLKKENPLTSKKILSASDQSLREKIHQLQPDLIFYAQTFYNLKDWIFARQRYWGEPFPLLHKKGKVIPLADKDLPLLLPEVSKTFFLTKRTIAPLAALEKWITKGYDQNVMPQWAGSCWYFLAYLLQKENGTFFPLNSLEAKSILDKWMPVDLYIGGYEHAVTHLIYARFWTYFLYELQLISHPEPFTKLLNQGLILAKDGTKMSKSKGNVINPNNFLLSHGADAMRLHINFLGSFQQKVSWNEDTLDAMRKWLARIYRLFFEHQNFFTTKPTPHLDYIYAKTVKEVTANFNNHNFNVAIAHLMTFINHCYKQKKISWLYFEGFLKLLYPLCPHLTEEIWWQLGKKTLLIDSSWPSYDQQKLVLNKVNMALQINGKTKRVLSFAWNLSENEVVNISKQYLHNHLFQKRVRKVIFVKNKIINFVI